MTGVGDTHPDLLAQLTHVAKQLKSTTNRRIHVFFSTVIGPPVGTQPGTL